jgi:hypothetical protein
VFLFFRAFTREWTRTDFSIFRVVNPPDFDSSLQLPDFFNFLFLENLRVNLELRVNQRVFILSFLEQHFLGVLETRNVLFSEIHHGYSKVFQHLALLVQRKELTHCAALGVRLAF